jgi:hypothetical protein
MMFKIPLIVDEMGFNRRADSTLELVLYETYVFSDLPYSQTLLASTSNVFSDFLRSFSRMQSSFLPLHAAVLR